MQTYSPEEYSIECARGHDFGKFYKHEIRERKALFYPPFSRLALVLFTGIRENRVRKAAQVWMAHLRDYIKNEDARGLTLLGPAPGSITRIKGRFRWQIAVKCNQTSVLHTMLEQVKTTLANLDRTIKVTVDIDPLDML